ncbi:nucleoside-diphosphate-sugar epimerase [Salsuginibacillus halophilus]|uniref:Nucleoside-diphosphate-sugar epimerase n=1 Tax=Salsuginibacillus halophilus TaxID=517424 RepID=A0A2P8HXR6_9BACI|nr:SDR family oxidoreductase [Salsuginibacillus halophilus]PSL50997.1 nucleoside-diphosphate-sugar epimerase [Salsuginibacillus halophilus]
MKVLVVGAHGKVGRHIVSQLNQSEGHEVTAMIRDESQKETIEAWGADNTVIADLEGDISHAFSDKDAVVFAAGSGPSTGGDKTLLIDLWGALKTIDESVKQGVKRFVMLSAMRAEDPESGPEKIRHYLVAKKLADDHLAATGLDYTIVRPGPLTNEEGTGNARIAPLLHGVDGQITREDTARVIVETLETENTIGKTFDVLNGSEDIETALKNL